MPTGVRPVTAAGQLVVDARFRSQPSATGVHRWAGSVLAALAARGVELVELAPTAGSGPRGHAWEQGVLPLRYRAVRSELPLFSPCNWGPLAVANQALVVHDVAPLVLPEHFSRAYVTLARTLLPALARRARTVLTVSERSRADIVAHLGVAEDKVVVVGAGATALRAPDPGAGWFEAPSAPWFVVVGAHDERKNVAFLLDLWPQVHARTGAHLVVTRRPQGLTTVASPLHAQPWCTELVNPSDAVLGGARALPWPSRYEGFGLPLLEAYQLGTAVVASDTGAARELAIPADPVLPLDRDAWIEAIVAAADTSPTVDAASAVARRFVAAANTWDAVAQRVWAAVAGY